MKEPEVYIYASPDHLYTWLSNLFIRMAHSAKGRKQILNIALSGGKTPVFLFEKLSADAIQIPWENLCFFWVDERCVNPENEDSNYGNAYKTLFSKVNIPAENLNRIQGENDPAAEALRYGDLIKKKIKKRRKKYPVFDWILLGAGEDGHTASIFPEDTPVIQSRDICTVATHPQNGQKRVTLTLPVINQADRITFIASGINKSGIISRILGEEYDQTKYPAAMVYSEKQPVEWYIDEAAGSEL
jgi:6-phosphogluconolactonase